ncbi:unnamed protein product [Vitrella brassicaformis CCMP3155]|uniref:Uncharacterized protein n=1 Tax=Vitrella brassicaformis (strain CCMP3155) TaxID=1169540 RepID=A0A0G4F2Q1_VITBC|nr:unnamed protein product [Vitrella brassicaformis CCMP3155]|eukprot:CEM05839.1 unnamed protein product [Vitrella brassicaformis CCMP3155]
MQSIAPMLDLADRVGNGITRLIPTHTDFAAHTLFGLDYENDSTSADGTNANTDGTNLNTHGTTQVMTTLTSPFLEAFVRGSQVRRDATLATQAANTPDSPNQQPNQPNPHPTAPAEEANNPPTHNSHPPNNRPPATASEGSSATAGTVAPTVQDSQPANEGRDEGREAVVRVGEHRGEGGGESEDSDSDMSEGWESQESDSEVSESEESEFSSGESDSDVSEGWESEESDSEVSEGWESEDSSEDSEGDVWETESAPSGYKHHPDQCFPSPKDAFNAYVKKAAFERSLSPEGRHESPQQHYERSVPAEEDRLIIEAGLSRERFDSMVLLGAYALWEGEKTAGRPEKSSEHYYYAALAAEREALAISYIKKIQLSRLSTSA